MKQPFVHHRVPHPLEAAAGEELEFVIFGTPPMSIDDERARPRKGKKAAG